MQPSQSRQPKLGAQTAFEKMSLLASVGSTFLVIGLLIWSASLIVKGVSRFVQPVQTHTIRGVSSPPYRFTQVKSVPTGLFRYGGSTAWAPIRLVVDSSIQAQRLEFQLRYVEPSEFPASSSEGIRMLLSGQLSFAQSARPLMQWEYEAAKQRGFRLKQIPVAIDGIALAVHPRLKLSGLTLDQLQLIYSGQIRNWKQVGGPDLNITPYWRSRNATSGMTLPLGGLHTRPSEMTNLKFVSTTTSALNRLAEFPGGIYYASASLLAPQCSVKLLPLGRQPDKFVAPYNKRETATDRCPTQRYQSNLRAFQTGQYPITRYLYVIVKENREVEQQAGEAYANFLLTPQGQALLSQAGFAPLR